MFSRECMDLIEVLIVGADGRRRCNEDLYYATTADHLVWYSKGKVKKSLTRSDAEGFFRFAVIHNRIHHHNIQDFGFFSAFCYV